MLRREHHGGEEEAARGRPSPHSVMWYVQDSCDPVNQRSNDPSQRHPSRPPPPIYYGPSQNARRTGGRLACWGTLAWRRPPDPNRPARSPGTAGSSPWRCLFLGWEVLGVGGLNVCRRRPISPSMDPIRLAVRVSPPSTMGPCHCWHVITAQLLLS